MLNVLSDKLLIMEEWKNIKDYEGSYQCSNTGLIRTLDRYVTEKSGKRQFRKGQIIKPRINKNGYLQVALNKNGIRKMCYVHKIIAETFVFNDDPEIKITVNHIDGNKNNNFATNLEWCSYSDNNEHSYRTLHRNVADAGASKVHVTIIDTNTNQTYEFESITETSQSINLSHTQINRYLDKNKKWKDRYLFLSDKTKCVEDIERVS